MTHDDPAAPEGERSTQGSMDAPTDLLGILRHLGPGLIIAGSIVGSGELIATTATGAEAGFWLLWLVLIGCVIKVFTQVELGRYTIVSGDSALDGLNSVPGPRIGRRVNWLVLYWVVMFAVSLGQLGGIVGGVGQALSISVPITAEGRDYNRAVDAETRARVALKELELAARQASEVSRPALADLEALGRDVAAAADVAARSPEGTTAGAALAGRLDELDRDPGWPGEGLAWATLHEVVAKGPPPLAGRAREIALEARLPSSERIERVRTALAAVDVELEGLGPRPPAPHDDRIWAAIVTVVTAAVLYFGRYGLIQAFSTALVFLFTAITVINLFWLQSNETWAITGDEILRGLSFRLTPADEAVGKSPLFTALATFGIIGVGASELVYYPYWCLEKGYARYVGTRAATEAWAHRARGWLRVLQWDAWCSAVVYTFATVAFYLLGAAILGRIGLEAEGTEMVRTLGVMYEPVFGHLAEVLFLFGAFAVLYSTFFVANASNARVFGDALRVVGLFGDSPTTLRRVVRILSALLPFVCLTVYLFVQAPKMLVLASGTMQALMLPMLAGATLYYRYRRSDRRLLPGKVWDAFLWVSALAMLLAGLVLLAKLF